MEPVHVPVMVGEVMTALALRPGDVAVDGTLGLGGHAAEIAAAISPGGTLIGCDRDPNMLEIARRRLADVKPECRLELVHSDFRDMGPVLDRLGLRANGVLLDLGLNSVQLDDPSRGMGFKHDGPLDLRMDQTSGEPASAVLNRLSPTEIERILFDYADERWAKAIARKIVERRKTAPLRTTGDLVQAVLAAVPAGARETRIHPATRTFQAIRIYVNRELEDLDDALRRFAARLAECGTLVVISFQSGEDRIVKHTFRDLARQAYDQLYRKPLVPREQEVARNPRSRSAKLRALRKALVTADLQDATKDGGPGIRTSACHFMDQD